MTNSDNIEYIQQLQPYKNYLSISNRKESTDLAVGGLERVIVTC